MINSTAFRVKTADYTIVKVDLILSNALIWKIDIILDPWDSAVLWLHRDTLEIWNSILNKRYQQWNNWNFMSISAYKK